MIIAIDGPAASGKGTLAKRIALRYGLPHLDTGMLYRAVARDLLASGASLEDSAAAARIARGLDLTTLTDKGLRSREVGEAASVVAAYPNVRAELVDIQRKFAARPQGAVLEGRDIGTVVCPAPILNYMSQPTLKREQGVATASCWSWARRSRKMLCSMTCASGTSGTSPERPLLCVKRTARTCSILRNWI